PVAAEAGYDHGAAAPAPFDGLLDLLDFADQALGGEQLGSRGPGRVPPEAFERTRRGDRPLRIEHDGGNDAKPAGEVEGVDVVDNGRATRAHADDPLGAHEQAGVVEAYERGAGGQGGRLVVERARREVDLDAQHGERGLRRPPTVGFGGTRAFAELVAAQ